MNEAPMSAPRSLGPSAMARRLGSLADHEGRRAQPQLPVAACYSTGPRLRSSRSTRAVATSSSSRSRAGVSSRPSATAGHGPDRGASWSRGRPRRCTSIRHHRSPVRPSSRRCCNRRRRRDRRGRSSRRYAPTSPGGSAKPCSAGCRAPGASAACRSTVSPSTASCTSRPPSATGSS